MSNKVNIYLVNAIQLRHPATTFDTHALNFTIVGYLTFLGNRKGKIGIKSGKASRGYL